MYWYDTTLLIYHIGVKSDPPSLSGITLQTSEWYSRMLSKAEHLVYATSHWSDQVFRNDSAKQVKHLVYNI